MTIWTNEPSFHSSDSTWFGERYYFQHGSFLKKQWLEVIYYAECELHSYRIVSQSGLLFSVQQGVELPYQDETLPFWCRKIFYLFCSTRYPHLRNKKKGFSKKD